MVVVELWIPNGGYVTALMGGSWDPSYGTSWALLDLKLSYKNYSDGASTGEKIKIHVDENGLRGEESALASKIAEPVRLVQVRRMVADATIEAGKTGVAFGWIDKPFTDSSKKWTWGQYAHWDENGYVDHNDPNTPNPKCE